MRAAVTLLLALAVAATGLADELRFTVTYRSVSSVYLDGGSLAGLAVGDRLSVLSDGASIAELEVAFVAERSASCRVLRETRRVDVGDVAVIEKELPKEPEEMRVLPGEPRAGAAAPRVAVVPQPTRSAPWARTRGGVSFGWRRTWDDTASALDFESTTLRLDLAAWDMGGKPYRLDVRMRARQDRRLWNPVIQEVPRDERRDRIYALSLSYSPPEGRVSWAVGRLGATPAVVGFLDGGLLELRLAGPLRLGGFFGTRSEIQSGDLQAAGRKYGGFLRLTPLGRGAAWDATLAAVRETADGAVSREYLGYQGRLASGRVSTWQWLELDLNQDWREALAQQKVQLSNLSLSGAYRVSSATSLALSYDRRRNYRTAETRSVPEELFDTFVRQGLRASLNVAPRGSFALRAFAGWRKTEGDRPAAHSYGAGIRTGAFWNARISLDATGFSNGVTSGVFGFASLSRRFASTYAALTYALSTYTLDAGDGTRRTNHSLRGSLRGDVGRHLWLSGELELDRGDDQQGPRVSVEAGYRF